MKGVSSMVYNRKGEGEEERCIYGDMGVDCARDDYERTRGCPELV